MTRSKAASIILKIFMTVHTNLISFGTIKNLYMDSFFKLDTKSKQNKFVIAHDGFLKTMWNMYILVFIVYTAAYQPFKIAFVEEQETWDMIVDSIMDVTFITDIIINFFTDYIETESNQRITSFHKIAKHYLTTSFALDLVAGFPF